MKRRTPVWMCSLLAIAICGVSILVGLRFPMSVSPITWKLIISGYVLISAGLPVAEFHALEPDLEQAYLRSGIGQVD